MIEGTDTASIIVDGNVSAPFTVYWWYRRATGNAGGGWGGRFAVPDGASPTSLTGTITLKMSDGSTGSIEISNQRHSSASVGLAIFTGSGDAPTAMTQRS
jgi:hypothetical protein